MQRSRCDRSRLGGFGWDVRIHCNMHCTVRLLSDCGYTDRSLQRLVRHSVLCLFVVRRLIPEPSAVSRQRGDLFESACFSELSIVKLGALTLLFSKGPFIALRLIDTWKSQKSRGSGRTLTFSP